MAAKTKYEKAINALIPLAEAEARLQVEALGKKDEIRYEVYWDGEYKKYTHDFFSEFYHKAMNRLAFEAGLRPML